MENIDFNHGNVQSDYKCHEPLQTENDSVDIIVHYFELDCWKSFGFKTNNEVWFTCKSKSSEARHVMSMNIICWSSRIGWISTSPTSLSVSCCCCEPAGINLISPVLWSLDMIRPAWLLMFTLPASASTLYNTHSVPSFHSPSESVSLSLSVLLSSIFIQMWFNTIQDRTIRLTW